MAIRQEFRVQTKLEEASFFAKRALAMKPTKQQS